MQKALFLKACIVAAVFSVLVIALGMIRGIALERAARQQAVAQEIAASSFGRQVIAGPVLAIPYSEAFDERIGEGRDQRIERRRIDRVLHLFPAAAAWTGTAGVAEKRRGLFRVRTFDWRAGVEGEFVLDGRIEIERTRPDSHIVWGRPIVAIGLHDPRGLAAAPDLEWAGERLAFERGSALPGMTNGVHAIAPRIDPTSAQRLAYRLKIGLQGTESLAIVPVAGDNRVSIRSDWPHPSFRGQFLPEPQSQRIGREGFSAQWAISSLASNAQQQLYRLFGSGKEALAAVDRLEVAFVDPIDIYTLSDRAVKYGFLFVGLTFGCLLLFEVLRRLPIHPAQYALVGLALAAFFLLLIALSEHFVFWAAYLAAAAACVALMGYYLSAVLAGVARGVGFAVLFTALYSALYGLLVSEDSALLLGALLVFGLTAAAMVLTRNVDWYRLGTGDAQSERSSSRG